MSLTSTTNNPRIVSPAIDLEWLGWRTNTMRLAQAGWRLSVEEDIQQNRIRMALDHPDAQVVGYADYTTFNYAQRDGYNTRNDMLGHPMGLLLSFKLAHNIMVHHHDERGYITRHDNWAAVDPNPNYAFNKVASLKDLALFRTLPSQEKDIVIAKPSFDEVLQMALEHQAPKQKELREKARRGTKMGAILRVAA